MTGVAAKASIGRAVTASMVKRGATQEIAEAVAAKAVSKIATGAAITTGATGSVGSAGVNTRDTVLGMSFDELAGSDTFRQSFTRIDQISRPPISLMRKSWGWPVRKRPTWPAEPL